MRDGRRACLGRWCAYLAGWWASSRTFLHHPRCRPRRNTECFLRDPSHLAQQRFLLVALVGPPSARVHRSATSLRRSAARLDCMTALIARSSPLIGRLSRLIGRA